VQSIRNPFLFTGQRLDFLDGGNLLLYDYKARAYDPLHGRFQQRDPAEFADRYNLYEYAQSRPHMATDPTGEFTLTCPRIMYQSL
jgi:RHS repeat-associated protein